MIKRSIYFFLIALTLNSCAGSKEIGGAKTPTGQLPPSLVNMQKKQLKSFFIDAKSAQISGDIAKAKKLFNGVYEKDNTCHACAYELASIYINERNIIESLKWNSRAIAEDPNNPFYLEQQAELLFRSGDYQGAANTSLKLVDSFPQSRVHYNKTLFYLNKVPDFKESRRVLIKYENKFGYNYETFKLCEYVYKSAKDSVAMLENYERLSIKYGNDPKVQESFIGFLIVLKKFDTAAIHLNTIEKKALEQSIYLPLRIQMQVAQKDWKGYIISLKKLTQSSDQIIDKAYPYMIESDEISDTSILDPLYSLSILKNKYNKYYNYYKNRLVEGEQKNSSSKYERQWKNNKKNVFIAKKLHQEYADQYRWKDAAEISKYLLDNNPAIVEYYIWHANNLNNDGQYETAYTIANQGELYAISKKETCQLILLQAQSNWYLGKKKNVNEDLKRAWSFSNDSIPLMEDLVIFTLLTNNLKDKVNLYVKNSESKLLKQLVSLMKLNSFSDVKWSTLLNQYSNFMLKEIAVHFAESKGELNKAERFLNEIKERCPNHRYYHKISE